MNKIIFTNILNVSEEYAPTPSLKIIPEWYKKTPSYINNEKKPDGAGNTTATIKKCMPVFDALTAGYIISTYVDIYISKTEDGNVKIEAPSFDPLGFHPIEQAELIPGKNKKTKQFPKWINPWGIKTPNGYSCLFLPPMHHPNEFFKVLPGIVDTDEYISPINFPFMFNDPEFTGLIPAGTPMVQVIPFKRDSWEMEFGTQKDVKKHFEVSSKLRSVFFDSYKNKFRKNKEYR
jgi:hypothetical protein